MGRLRDECCKDRVTANTYSYAYYDDRHGTDYTVEGDIQIPADSLFGGGIGGRVNPATGAHYGAWVYPPDSVGGKPVVSVLKLWKFRSWTDIDLMTSMMDEVDLPPVGIGQHTLKMTFTGNQIKVYYDDGLEIERDRQ